jgi:uncharacterized coiled-coil DUF342 family protein
MTVDPMVRRDELQQKANQLRKERDRLNDEARAHAEERDGYNAQVRDLVNEANEHKKRRDLLNEQVRRQKVIRDEANHAADEAHKLSETLRRERMPADTPEMNVTRLKQEARTLEFQQMTQVLKPEKERAIVERLQHIGKLLRAKDKVLKSDPELKAALDKADVLKDKAEKEHAKVGDLAETAQAEHDAMIKLYKQSDKIRKTADKLQERFVVSKMEADKIHKAYIEYVNQIQDQLGGSRGGRSHDQKQAEAAADEVFEKFKAGEKLSTDDLLLLQKAGLL